MLTFDISKHSGSWFQGYLYWNAKISRRNPENQAAFTNPLKSMLFEDIVSKLYELSRQENINNTDKMSFHVQGTFKGEYFDLYDYCAPESIHIAGTNKLDINGLVDQLVPLIQPAIPKSIISSCVDADSQPNIQDTSAGKSMYILDFDFPPGTCPLGFKLKDYRDGYLVVDMLFSDYSMVEKKMKIVSTSPSDKFDSICDYGYMVYDNQYRKMTTDELILYNQKYAQTHQLATIGKLLNLGEPIFKIPRN